MLIAGGLVLTLFLLAGGNYLLARPIQQSGPGDYVADPSSVSAAGDPRGGDPRLPAGSKSGPAGGEINNVSSRTIMLLAVVAPCVISPNPTTAITGTVVGTGITTVTAMVLMLRACNTGDWRPTLDGMKRQIKFSIPLGLSSPIGTLYQTLDEVFVAALCPAAAFAVFMTGAREIPLIGIVTGSVTSVLIVEYARLHGEGKPAEIVGLIHRAMLIRQLILIPVMAFLLCMAPELMRLLYGAPYKGPRRPFRVYLLLLPTRTLTFSAHHDGHRKQSVRAVLDDSGIGNQVARDLLYRPHLRADRCGNGVGDYFLRGLVALLHARGDSPKFSKRESVAACFPGEVWPR